MSNKFEVVFLGFKTGNDPRYYRSVSECRAYTLQRIAQYGFGEDRLGAQVGGLPSQAVPSSVLTALEKYINSPSLNGVQPKHSAISNFPDEETRVCVNTLPSYSEAKDNGVISMNPYVNSLRKIWYRTVRFGEHVVCNAEGESHLNAPSSYLGWKDVVAGGSFGEDWTPYFLVVTKLDYWTLSSEHNGLILSTKTIVDRTDPDLVDLVYTKLMAEASRADLDMSTQIAELGEAVGMLKNLIPNAARNISNLRHLQLRIAFFWFTKAGRRRIRALLREGKTLPDVLAEYWMLYRYGIMPLYYAVEDIKKMLKRQNAQFVTARTGEEKGDNRVAFRTPSLTGAREEQRYETSVRTHGVWKGRGLDLAAKKSQSWLPTTLWELVPLSFVVDWFVNAGDFIQSLRPISATASRYCISTKTTSEFNIKMVQLPTVVETSFSDRVIQLGIWLSVQQSGFETRTRRAKEVIAYVDKTTAFQRSVGLGNRTLTTDANLNLRRVLDSIALLWQLVSR